MGQNKLLLIDVNVLLELYLRRPNYLKAVQFVEENSDKKLCISPASVHIFIYFIQKAKKDPLPAVIFLNDFFVLPLDDVSTKWALANCPDDDYEDALQAACAVFGDCEKIATFDKNFANNYSRYIDVELIS